jgi:DNA modification methylase
MGYWTDLSIEFANQRNYLDELFKVYPTIPDGIRNIDKSRWKYVEDSFKAHNNISLITHLLYLDLFPIKDSYVAYLKRDPDSIQRNPNTINRLCGRLYEMGLDKIFEKCSEPKETNRQIGPLFKRWLANGGLGIKPIGINEFQQTSENAVLDASDVEMKDWCAKNLNYSRNKGLDFVGRFNKKYIIGEAKFLTDFGGHQNAQFADAISTITNSSVKAITIAILDGVLYIKTIMYEIFGMDNFRNDITRIKCNPKNFYRKAYGNTKDMILFYSKTKDLIWNDPKLPFSEKDKNNLFRKINKNGRAYTTIPLHAPGETKNGATSGIFKGLKPPKGRHWRCSPQELEELDSAGLIEWSSNGNPRKIIYADEADGKKMQDIWEFKDYQYPVYPTEKNIDLLRTIISASSNEGSTVLDFFCGSGTTLIAAQELNRNWIGIDQSEQAIKIAKMKLDNIEKTLFSDIGYTYLEAELVRKENNSEMRHFA